MPDRPALLCYPEPALTDGVVLLRRWAESDIRCVQTASRDPSIARGTTVPATFTDAERGIAARPGRVAFQRGRHPRSYLVLYGRRSDALIYSLLTSDRE